MKSVSPHIAIPGSPTSSPVVTSRLVRLLCRRIRSFSFAGLDPFDVSHSFRKRYFDGEPQYDTQTGDRRVVFMYLDRTVAPGKVRPCASELPKSVWASQR